MSNLVGKWKLVREGSDIMPGLENMPGAPLVLKLLGESTAEFYKIEKKKVLDIEEISLSFVTKNASVNKSVEVGTLNFEQITNQDVTLSVVQNVDDNFKEFSLVRLGPKCGQNSKETYTLDASLNKLKLQVEITADDGTRLNLIKYLSRFDTSVTPDVALKNAVNTQGWRIFDFWPTTTLTNTKVTVIKALKVKMQSSSSNENGKVVEAVWSRPLSVDDSEEGIDLGGISRQVGHQLGEGEEVVEFVIKVVHDDKVWVVAHRYKEFDALRRFLLIQNPHVASFKECDAKFPRKVVGLGFRRSVWLEQRAEGLEAFLSFFLANARYCRQNSVDALCSFLTIPENMARTARTHEIGRSSTVAFPSNSTNNASASLALLRAVETAPVAQIRPVSQVKPVVAAPQPPVPATPVKATAKPVAPTPTTPVAIKTPAPPAAATPSKPPAASAASLPVVAIVPVANNFTIPSVAAQTTSSTSSSSSTAGTAVSGKTAMSDSVCQTISSSANRAQQVARETLFASLEKGLAVVKHGRQGNPHTRVLQCDAGVTKLFWQPSEGKAISVADIAEIRRGTDVDRAATSPAALAAYENRSSAPVALTKKKSIRQSILMTGPDDEVHFGTATLRRHGKPEHMGLCLSLILPDRTFDIQCASLEDFDLLYHNLNILMRK